MTSATHSEELERLWAGEFGNAYLGRNIAAGHGRGPFWHSFLDRYPIDSVLEVGCTQGDNLRYFTGHVEPQNIYGLDVNPVVLQQFETNIPGARAVQGVARQLPFPDASFDLVFTVGLLIHIPDESLPSVLRELSRTSSHYVFCGEYHADQPEEIKYRDREGILFKRDYGRLFIEHSPDLRMVDHGFLTKESGFDRVTWHLFERA
jgi:pseudaminic acid biosynthesis-associated methylase